MWAARPRSLVAGQVDPDGPALCRSLVAQAQDRLGLPVAGQAGRDVAELAAVGHVRFTEVGAALHGMGGDPRGDGGAGLRAGVIGHAGHDGPPRDTCRGHPACRLDRGPAGPYVRVMILPGSWAEVLEPCRPVFARRGTFVLFTVLATGLVASTGRRSVVGMLAGARMAQQISFHAACRFFSAAVWDVDRLGLVVARLIVSRLLGPGEPVTVVIDDTLFKRWGRHVWHAHWTHDGAAQGGKKIARGNRWVIAGIVVRLPFCTAPVCLPVLMRLWAGKGSTTPVELAAQLLALLVAAFPDREVHGVGDAAYHGKPLLVADTTWTTRLPANASLSAWAPPRTGKRGRPRLKGAKLGKLKDLATAATWTRTSVYRYGRTETVDLAII